MDRTIPYWLETIEKKGIDEGKSVLVASSENAIRGLLMHLLGIPKVNNKPTIDKNTQPVSFFRRKIQMIELKRC